MISFTSEFINTLLINADSYSEAALNALKRHQLQSLTKRYGLKSNGKVSFVTSGGAIADRQNSEMVQRLQECTSRLKLGHLGPLTSSRTNYVSWSITLFSWTISYSRTQRPVLGLLSRYTPPTTYCFYQPTSGGKN